MCRIDCKFNREQEIKDLIADELHLARIGYLSANHDHAEIWEPELYRQLIQRLESFQEKAFPENSNKN